MEPFSLFLDALGLTGQSILHIIFTGRLTGKRPRLWHFPAYLAFLCAIEWTSLPAIPALVMELLALYGMGRFALQVSHPASCAASLLAVYITQLSFGIVDSAEAILFPAAIGSPLLYPLVILAAAAGLMICACCCAAVLRSVSLSEDSLPQVGILLFPGAFFFAAELYILHTAYSVLPAAPVQERIGTHSALLFLQTLGLAALLCTLHAYRRLCRGLQTQSALQSLTQAAQAQKTYIAEAQLRYEQTRSFRHDIKNHLSVLDGLLRAGKPEESRAYLQKLEASASALSFPYRTGDPAADVLLGEKLGLAEAAGIPSEVSVLLPKPCKVDSLDLCVIFANALDNAIQACRTADGPQSIRITGTRQGDFYMLSFENTCASGPLPPAGTGLSNIRSVAEKYHGAMLAEKNGCRFSLNVLLNIS